MYDWSHHNPRENQDNLGTMVCFHRRYLLGDKHNLSAQEAIKRSESPDYLSLPLYLYDHSGLSMSTTEFSCPWDSGQVGFILVHKKKIREEFCVGRVTAKLRKQVYRILEAEVKEYDTYLQS